jgi:prepilin-type processing-associated H-X9-DG protein
LAVHHYEFNAEQLPSGVINPEGPIRAEQIGQHVSWIVGILPYIEQPNAYRKFDQAAGAYAPVNKPVRAEQIPTLLCPSHPNVVADRTDDLKIALTDYAGCHHDSEAPVNDDNNGVLFLNSRLRLSKISDGLSQTILLGEIRDVADSLGWVSGTRSSLRNTGSLNDPKTIEQNSSGVPNAPAEPEGSLRVGGFGSFHTGGAQFVFADGSMRFISTNIDREAYRKLGNRADGELFGEASNGW